MQTAEQVVLSKEAWEEYREIYRADPWEFAIDICGLDKLVERFHKPLIYLLTHQIHLLIDVLRGPLKSAVITKIKRALDNKRLDYRNDAHAGRIEEFSRTLNLRLARKLGKTSCGEAAIAWDITVDPNQAWGIVSRDDPAAEAMCAMIGKIIRGDAYRFFFPDRVPEDEHKALTNSSIRLAGRTHELPQPCVTAAGVDSGWVSAHFTRLYCDDLVGRENKGETKLRVVREFQTNKNGLKVPEWDAPFLYFSTGTRWARKDDAWALDSDPDCLSIYVMIEERTGPVTFANMMESGEPTLPEWFDKAKIQKEKQDYLKDKDLGAVALMANLFLTIAGDAAKVFNDEIVDARRFQWVIDENNRRCVMRLKDHTKPQTSKILQFPVRKLEIKAGADPSASMTGDNWGITAAGRDSFGVHYQIKSISGHGADGFLDALLYIDETYNPDEIGIEQAAMQAWVLIAISKDTRFTEIVHKFKGVPTNLRSKRARAINLVAAPLEMGEIYLSPDDDNPLPVEMKEWDPDNKYAIDGCIDSMGVVMALYTTPASATSAKEVEEMTRIDNARYEKSLDRDFGIPIEDVGGDDYFIDDNFDDEAVGF